MLRKTLRFFNIRDPEVLQRLYRLSRMVLHPLKNNRPAKIRPYLLIQNRKHLPQPMRLDLHFNQLLNRLLDRSLRLPNTDNIRPFRHRVRNHLFGKEMPPPLPPPSIYPLVPRRLSQRQKYRRTRKVQIRKTRYLILDYRHNRTDSAEGRRLKRNSGRLSKTWGKSMA